MFTSQEAGNMNTCPNCGNDDVKEGTIKLRVTTDDCAYEGWVSGHCCEQCRSVIFTFAPGKQAAKMALAEKAVELGNRTGALTPKSPAQGTHADGSALHILSMRVIPLEVRVGGTIAAS